MEAYRSILLADCEGKLFAIAYRMDTIHQAVSFLRNHTNWQCGGVSGLGTEFPALCVRLLEENSKATHQSLALLFVDARQAFYAVLRKCVIPIEESGEAIIHMFRTLQIPPEAMTELITILQQAPAFQDAELPPTFIQDTTANYTNIFFQVSGSNLAGSAKRGTRPGHPYADLVFAFAFHKVLEDVATRMDAVGLRPTITNQSNMPSDHGGELYSLIPSFFDDFVVAITATDPADLLLKTKADLGCIAASLAIRGMQVNDFSGKTEVIIEFHGTHSNEVAARHNLEEFPTISYQSPLHPDLNVHIVDDDKHLG